jgi:DNA-3-methyladenine glycosylase II
VAALVERDRDLAGIVERHGPPPIWAREPGFATLLHIVLEQQVSLASAQAAFDRLERAAGSTGSAADEPGSLTPERFLAFSDGELLEIGFSRQKARYGRALAERIGSGALDLDALVALDDDDVARALEAVPGIGPWTSTIYLLMVLRRPDVWPVGDIALATAVAEVKGLSARPSIVEMAMIGDAWRPWRSTAARLLWHDYLRRRGRPG